MEYRPRGVRIEDSRKLSYDDEDDEGASPEAYGDDEEEGSRRLRHLSESKVTEDQDPFMGMKVRRMDSLRGDYKGDYIDVLSHPFLVEILWKQEYDLLIASWRKIQIAIVLVESTKSASDYELEVVFSNRFEYHASSDMVKEVQFEEGEDNFE